MEQCLEELSTVVGASRSCVCIVGSSQGDDAITAFVSGGSQDVPTLGASLLGMRIEDIPEWAPLFVADHRSIVSALDEAAPTFRSVLDAAELDWIVTTAIVERGRTTATLSLLGRGPADGPGRRLDLALDAVAELIRAVLHSGGDARTLLGIAPAGGAPPQPSSHATEAAAHAAATRWPLPLPLSEREHVVVDLLLQGHRVSTIAGELYLSPHTVRNHLKSIFRKVGVSSQAELIRVLRTRHPER